MRLKKNTTENKTCDIKALRKIVTSSPYFQHLGMEFLEIKDGFASVSMEIKPCHMNTQKIVHGGALFSLADTAGLVAICTKVPINRRPRTIQMDINYLAPANGKRLVATGRVLKIGYMAAFGDIEVVDDNKNIVVTARCTCMIVNVKNNEKMG